MKAFSGQKDKVVDPEEAAAEAAAAAVVAAAVRGGHAGSTRPAATGQSVPVPDGGWGWFVVFATFVVQALTIGSTYTFGVMYVDLLRVFKCGESATSWIGSIQSSLLYMTGLLAGPLIQTFGCRLVGLCGAILSCAGFAVSSLAPNIYVLFITYGAMTGIGNGLMYVTSSVVIQLYFNRYRSVATGISVTGSGIGTLVFGFATNYMLEGFGWRWTLVIEGGLMLVGGFCALVYRPLASVVPENDERRHLLGSSGRADATREVVTFGARWRTFLTSLFDFSLFRCPPFVLFCIMSACFSFGYHVPYTYTPERAQRMYGVDAQRAAFLVSLMGVANVASRPLFGWVADRSAALRFHSMVAVTILCGLTSALIFLMTTYDLMIVYSVLFGAFGGCWASVYPVVVVDMMGVGDVEKSIGLSMAVASIGFLFAAPISGLIISATNGNFNLPYSFIGVVQVIGGLILLFARCFPFPGEAAGQEDRAGLPADESTASSPSLAVDYATECASPFAVDAEEDEEARRRSSVGLGASGSMTDASNLGQRGKTRSPAAATMRTRNHSLSQLTF